MTIIEIGPNWDDHDGGHDDDGVDYDEECNDNDV